MNRYVGSWDRSGQRSIVPTLWAVIDVPQERLAEPGCGASRVSGRSVPARSAVETTYRTPPAVNLVRLHDRNAAGDAENATAWEVAAASNLKRVRRAPDTEPDWAEDPGIERMTEVLETKTVWHPIGI